MSKRPTVHIDILKLSLALHKAARRPESASFIKNLLDETFDAELGRVTHTGKFATTEPSEDEKPTYISTQICVGPGTYEDGWREIVQRNPTDVQLVFDDFSAVLLSVVVDNKPLNLGPCNIDPSAKRVIRNWIAEKDADIKTQHNSPQPTEPTSIPEFQGCRSLSDFLVSSDEKLIVRIGVVLRGRKGKAVATVILALKELGYISVASGEYKELYRAIRDQYRFNIGSDQGITAYLSGRLHIPPQELDDTKHILMVSEQ